MKKIFVFVTLFVLAFTVEAKRKADQVLLDDEFNPWFLYDEPVKKVGLQDNSHKTTSIATKMDKIDPNSTKYTPSGERFLEVAPETIPIPTRKVIKRMFPIKRKIEHMSTGVDMKRANNP